MIKGDRIKLIKKMGAFNNIGEICEIIDIQEVVHLKRKPHVIRMTLSTLIKD